MMILRVAGGLGNERQGVGTREHSFRVLQELLEGYLQVLHIYVCLSPGTLQRERIRFLEPRPMCL